MADPGVVRLTTATRRLLHEVEAALADPPGDGSPGEDALPGPQLHRAQDRLLEALTRCDDARVDALVHLLERTETLHWQVSRALEADRRDRWALLEAEIQQLRGCDTGALLAERTCDAALRVFDATGAAFHRFRHERLERWIAAGTPATNPLDAALSRIVVDIACRGETVGRLEVLVPQTTDDEDAHLRALHLAQAVGFVLDTIDARTRLHEQVVEAQELRAAIQAAVSDDANPVFSLREIGTYVPAPVQATPDDLADSLTARQKDVLELLLRGMSNAQICERLAVSTPTVKAHVSALLSRAGAANRAELIAMCWKGESP